MSLFMHVHRRLFEQECLITYTFILSHWHTHTHTHTHTCIHTHTYTYSCSCPYTITHSFSSLLYVTLYIYAWISSLSLTYSHNKFGLYSWFTLYKVFPKIWYHSRYTGCVRKIDTIDITWPILIQMISILTVCVETTQNFMCTLLYFFLFSYRNAI